MQKVLKRFFQAMRAVVLFRKKEQWPDSADIEAFVKNMNNPHGHPSAIAIQTFFRTWVDEEIVKAKLTKAPSYVQMRHIVSKLNNYDGPNFKALAAHIAGCEKCLGDIYTHIELTTSDIWGHQEQFFNRLWNEIKNEI